MGARGGNASLTIVPHEGRTCLTVMWLRPLGSGSGGLFPLGNPSLRSSVFCHSVLVHAFGFIPAQKPEFLLVRAVRVRARIERNAASKRVHALDEGIAAARLHHGGLHALRSA